MIESIIGLFSGGAVGAITGLVGSYLTKREERATLKLQQQHEAKMRQFDIEEASQEHSQALALADKKIEQAKTEAEIAADVSAAETFNTSIKVGNEKSGIKWIDGVRSLMRPMITLMLLFASALLTYQISSLGVGLESLGSDELLQMYQQIIKEALFLTTTAVTWWFGTRGSSQFKR